MDGSTERCCHKKCRSLIDITTRAELQKLCKEQKEKYVKHHVKVYSCKTQSRKQRLKERNIYKKYFIKCAKGRLKEVCKQAFIKELDVSANFVEKYTAPTEEEKTFGDHNPVEITLLGDFSKTGENRLSDVNDKACTSKLEYGMPTENIKIGPCSTSVEDFDRDGLTKVNFNQQTSNPESVFAFLDEDACELKKIDIKRDTEIIRMNEPLDDHVSALGNSLKQCHQLSQLTVQNCFTSSKSMAVLADALFQMRPTLTSLNLSHNIIGVSSTNVANALEHHPHLKHLDISWCQLEETQFRIMAMSFQKIGHNLEVLNLNGNEINDTYYELAETLRSAKLLKQLSMADCNLSTTAFVKIFDALVRQKEIECLDFAGNHIRGNHDLLDSFENVIKDQSNLKTLNLNNCGLQPFGVERIAFALSGKSNLQNLSLEENNIGFAAPQLAKVLENCHFLEQLWLRKCSMGHEEIKVVVNALEKCGKLQILSLENNRVSGASHVLANFLLGKQNIQELWLRNCKLLPENIQELAKSLSPNQGEGSLVELDLAENTIKCGSCDAILCLIKALKTQPLSELWISNAGIEQEDEIFLQAELPLCEIYN